MSRQMPYTSLTRLFKLTRLQELHHLSRQSGVMTLLIVMAFTMRLGSSVLVIVPPYKAIFSVLDAWT